MMGMLMPHGLCNSKACKAEDDTARALCRHSALSLWYSLKQHAALVRLGNTSVMVMLYSGEHPWVNMQLTRYFRRRKLLIRAEDFTSQAMSAPRLHQLTTDLKHKKKLLASNNKKPSITPGYPGTINLTLSVSVTVLLTSCIMLHRVQKQLES